MSKRRGFFRRQPMGPRQSQQRDHELEAKVPGGTVTPELRRHQAIQTEVIATDSMGFATVARQKHVDKFERLQQDGTLTKAEAQAARQLQGYCDACYRGVVGAYQMRVDGSSRPGESMASKVDAVRRMQGALDHLNSELRKVAVAWILELHVPHMGNTFLAIGESLFPNLKDAERVRIAGKALAIATCRELAIHFRLADEFSFDVDAGASGIRRSRIRYMRPEPAQDAPEAQVEVASTTD